MTLRKAVLAVLASPSLSTFQTFRPISTSPKSLPLTKLSHGYHIPLTRVAREVGKRERYGRLWSVGPLSMALAQHSNPAVIEHESYVHCTGGWGEGVKGVHGYVGRTCCWILFVGQTIPPQIFVPFLFVVNQYYSRPLAYTRVWHAVCSFRFSGQNLSNISPTVTSWLVCIHRPF